MVSEVPWKRIDRQSHALLSQIIAVSAFEAEIHRCFDRENSNSWRYLMNISFEISTPTPATRRSKFDSFGCLPDEFSRYGVHYRLAQRTGMAAIFELRYRPGLKGPIIGWDVVLLVRRPERAKNATRWENTSKIIERFPSPEQWGSLGWSFDRLESAQRKLQEVSA